MDQVCGFMFLRNHLQKCFGALKYNQFYRLQKRRAPYNHMLKVKHKVFNVFRHKWHRNRMVFHNLRIRDYKIKASLFLTLKESWSYQRTIKLKFINLLRAREHSSLETCFSALRDWKITRYTASVKLDPHEKIRAKFLQC